MEEGREGRERQGERKRGLGALQRKYPREKSGTLPPSSLALGGTVTDVWREAACWSPVVSL